MANDSRNELIKKIAENVEKLDTAKRAMWCAQGDLQNSLMQSIDFVIGNVIDPVLKAKRYQKRCPSTAELMAVARYIGLVE